MILFYAILIITAISFFVVLYNYFTAPRLSGKTVTSKSYPKLSILIPARNEESNIENCLNTVLNQTYPDFEVIVLDDESQDRTEQKIKEYIPMYSKLKLIKGAPLPDGWTGKNWACHQLSDYASGELLLFIDADITLANDAIEFTVARFQELKVKMLTCFPSQILKSSGERMIVPLMDWILLSFLPLNKVYTSQNKSFVAANGQFIMFDKNTYFELGGHRKVCSKLVEDMELARNFKSNGKKIITYLGFEKVFCRMYNNFSSAFNGFIKNFYPGFNTSPAIFLFLITILLISFLLPFILVSFSIIYLIPVFLILAGRFLIALLNKQNPLINLLLHPFQMIIMFFIGLKSVYSYQKNSIIWKERKLSLKKI